MDHFIYSNVEDEKGPRIQAYEFGLNVFSNETLCKFSKRENVSHMSDVFNIYLVRVANVTRNSFTQECNSPNQLKCQ